MCGSISSSLTETVTEVLKDVGERVIMPRFRALSDGDVRSKSHPGDLVTIADEEAEESLSRTLAGVLPGTTVIGEESVAKNPDLLSALTPDQPVWIIDPIDGTANFVHGTARFAEIIALVKGGETIGGWIHNPVSGETLAAERGTGAWIVGEDGGTPVSVLDMSGRPLSELSANLHHQDLTLLKGKFERIIRMGSAAHAYWALSEGLLHVSCTRRLNPWDHAAGLLIHAEAGGYSRLLTGEKYDPCLRTQQGILCAPSQSLWQEVADLARPAVQT